MRNAGLGLLLLSVVDMGACPLQAEQNRVGTAVLGRCVQSLLAPTCSVSRRLSCPVWCRPQGVHSIKAGLKEEAGPSGFSPWWLLPEDRGHASVPHLFGYLVGSEALPWVLG